MVTIVDSSVWVALFLDFDTHHLRAQKIIKELDGEIIVPYCVTSEVASILTYKHSKQQADLFLDYLIYAEHLTLLEDVVRQEIAFYKTHKHRISFTDSALLFLSKKMGAHLITLDKQLLRLSKKNKV